jgi:hypothetical protein
MAAAYDVADRFTEAHHDAPNALTKTASWRAIDGRIELLDAAGAVLAKFTPR